MIKDICNFGVVCKFTLYSNLHISLTLMQPNHIHINKNEKPLAHSIILSLHSLSYNHLLLPLANPQFLYNYTTSLSIQANTINTHHKGVNTTGSGIRATGETYLQNKYGLLLFSV